MTKGLGFLPDDEEIVSAQLVAYPAHALVGVPVGLPGSITWRQNVDIVPDQGGTSSCVAQATSSSCYVLGQNRGTPIERPSVMATYAFARMAQVGPDAELFDGGTSPTKAFEILREYGLVAESRWPFDASRINEKPPLDVFHAGADALLGPYYRIANTSLAPDMIRQALAKGYIPTFAMSVDEAFMGWFGRAVYRGPDGESKGWHMQAIVGYADDYFEVLGSWGRNWADEGFVRIHESFFTTQNVGSILVPTIIPLKVT
jgi:C1A family cysteine protease